MRDFGPAGGCKCGYRLEDRNPSNGVTLTHALIPGGGTSYLRMSVAPGAFAGVMLRSGGVAPPSTIRLAVIRRQ